jgi:hypothetical protein
MFRTGFAGLWRRGWRRRRELALRALSFPWRSELAIHHASRAYHPRSAPFYSSNDGRCRAFTLPMARRSAPSTTHRGRYYPAAPCSHSWKSIVGGSDWRGIAGPLIPSWGAWEEICQ